MCWRVSCDVREVTERLENEESSQLQSQQSSFSNPFSRFTYVTADSPTLLLLHLHHSSFSNPFRRFAYVTADSPTFPLLHLHHSSFSNPSFASPTSQNFHLCHLTSRPCPRHIWKPLHTFHSKVKASTSEPLPYLLQVVTKISTLYNFYEWRVISQFATAILSGETELALGTVRVNF